MIFANIFLRVQGCKTILKSKTININLYGDTTFIALVNHYEYQSFVDNNWDLSMLKEHWIKQTIDNNILVFQMTEDGVEEWRISIEKQMPQDIECFRQDIGFINVTNGELCFVDYSFLTMVAQFDNYNIPNKTEEKIKFTIRFFIDNGLYKVGIFQFYNIAESMHICRSDTDILFAFTRVVTQPNDVSKVYWYTG